VRDRVLRAVNCEGVKLGGRCWTSPHVCASVGDLCFVFCVRNG